MRFVIPPCHLPAESFFIPETRTLFNQLEELSQRSGVSRAIAFEDFLSASVAALGHPLMEDDYLQTIEKHKDGKPGRRGVDKLAEMFATLVDLMTITREDILGDLFQGSITYGEKGQFLTPAPICGMLARMSLPKQKTGIEERRSINDPACGSGRMLLAAADVQPNWHFVGQDVDRRCVNMTALNLGLRNLYGHVVWGNSLANTCDLIYETGRVHIWGNAVRKVSRVPLPNREPEKLDVTPPSTSHPAATPAASTTSGSNPPSIPPEDTGPTKQLELF